MSDEAEETVQTEADEPRYDQRIVSDPIPSTMPAGQRNKVDNPAGREMYRRIIETGQPIMDKLIEDFRDAGR